MPATPLQFTKRDRRRMADTRYGYRPRSNWGEGNLPAPWAEGDLIEVPPGAPVLARMHGMPPGAYVVVYATSIGEGDDWYFRIWDGEHRRRSDRLHVIHAERSTEHDTIDFLAGCALIDTADPHGLALRADMLAGDWQLERDWNVVTERDLYRDALVAVVAGDVDAAAVALAEADRRHAAY